MIESGLDLRVLWKSQSEVELESVARSDGNNVGVGDVAQLENRQNLALLYLSLWLTCKLSDHLDYGIGHVTV